MALRVGYPFSACSPRIANKTDLIGSPLSYLFRVGEQDSLGVRSPRVTNET